MKKLLLAVLATVLLVLAFMAAGSVLNLAISLTAGCGFWAMQGSPIWVLYGIGYIILLVYVASEGYNPLSL
jgi:hypothetical protein